MKVVGVDAREPVESWPAEMKNAAMAQLKARWTCLYGDAAYVERVRSNDGIYSLEFVASA